MPEREATALASKAPLPVVVSPFGMWRVNIMVNYVSTYVNTFFLETKR
jgi:hypothetical protein